MMRELFTLLLTKGAPSLSVTSLYNPGYIPQNSPTKQKFYRITNTLSTHLEMQQTIASQ